MAASLQAHLDTDGDDDDDTDDVDGGELASSPQKQDREHGGGLE